MLIIFIYYLSLREIWYSFNDKSFDQFKDFSFSETVKIFNNISVINNRERKKNFRELNFN